MRNNRENNNRFNNPYYVPVRDRSCEKLYYRMHDAHVKGKTRLARFYKFIMWRAFYAFIPPSAVIGARLVLPHHGFGVVMNDDVAVGEDAIIFHNTTLGNPGIRIGDCFYIGAGAAIIGPVTIGNNVAVAPNAYVNRDIPDNAIVIGNPGKVVKIRNGTDFEKIKARREQFFAEI
jgi:serine O-acetyltransferase